MSWFRLITPVFTPNNGQVMAKVFGIAKMTLTMTFRGQNHPEWTNQYQKWIPHTSISQKRGIACAYSKKLDIHHRRWRPYLIGPLRHSYHYGGQAPRWFFISRDPLTQFKWEIPPTPNCERVYRAGTGLLCRLPLTQHREAIGQFVT